MNCIEEQIRDLHLGKDLFYETEYDKYLETTHKIYIKKDCVFSSKNQFAVIAFLKGYRLGKSN